MSLTGIFSREMKRGSAELLILALLEDGQRHGYEIAQLIEQRSGGVLGFHVASLYPMLSRVEKRGLIEGRWVGKAGQRRRRYYRLTRAGRQGLESQRGFWQDFVTALDRVARIRPGRAWPGGQKTVGRMLKDRGLEE